MLPAQRFVSWWLDWEGEDSSSTFNPSASLTPTSSTALNPRFEKTVPVAVVGAWLQEGGSTAGCCCLSAPPGGLSSIASDPVKAVNDVVDGSANLVGAVMKFAASLVAPDEDDGTRVTHTEKHTQN